MMTLRLQIKSQSEIQMTNICCSIICGISFYYVGTNHNFPPHWFAHTQTCCCHGNSAGRSLCAVCFVRRACMSFVFCVCLCNRRGKPSLSITPPASISAAALGGRDLFRCRGMLGSPTLYQPVWKSLPTGT